MTMEKMQVLRPSSILCAYVPDIHIPKCLKISKKVSFCLSFKGDIFWRFFNTMEMLLKASYAVQRGAIHA